MSELCFITTCRGRLSQLQQSLPTFVEQPGTSCIVVDYDCPEGTAAWVEQAYPSVRVVRSGPQARFELSRARNIGAAQADAPWLCFVDADVCLSPQFSATVLPLVKAGNFYLAQPRSIELWGTCICPRADFERIGGYDDVIQGWGAEDNDFYTRLKIIGLRYRTFPGELLSMISHEAEERVEHYEVKDQWLSATANRIYCRIKIDLMRYQQKNMAREERSMLYSSIQKRILDAHISGEPVEFGISLYREETFSCGPFEARLVYRLPQPRGNGTAPVDPRTASMEPGT